MNHTITELGAATLAALVLQAAALAGYLKVAKTIPKEHRMRLFITLTVLPVIVVLGVVVWNPPYALLLPLLAPKMNGPSG